MQGRTNVCGCYLPQAIGIETIHERVRCLSGWLLEQPLELRHSNGQPAVQIYGPITTERRGGTIAFNFCDPSGVVLDCYAVQEDANRHGCGLPESLAATYRKFGHVSKLACRAIRVAKTTEFRRQQPCLYQVV